MNQFKDVFLGFDNRPYKRAVSVQKCVRAGGKHNDLENVGYTNRHHTFFEMLGNFSFGDYFKREAIKLAWNFLTQELKLPLERLYVTVYHSDEEAYTIWRNDIGLPVEKIIRIGDKPDGGSDNFWQMGDVGPCGPCTEIFYDKGSNVAGGIPGSKDEDGDRYTEVWNCVFMQYNRDETGKLHSLPKPSVDTGMGLERITAVMQNVASNYDIDLFQALIAQAAKITQCKDLTNPSLKVIADHIRSISFLIADGVVPFNEGRGYVLRRIIRRAVRHGYKLGVTNSFLYQLVSELVMQMGDFYPELKAQQDNITRVIEAEEEKFYQTIANGMGLLQQELSSLNGKILSGIVAFKLYDTYGFPLDLTEDICKESQVVVNHAEFEQAMHQQKNRAKSASKFKLGAVFDYDGAASEFLGYEDITNHAKVLALFDSKQQPVTRLNVGEAGVVVLDNSVFYAESGGQAGDSGIITNKSSLEVFTVQDTQKIRQDVIGHLGVVTADSLNIGDEIIATINEANRTATQKNHSATHLLHKALHEVLGSHALQKGSYVCHEYTRFDFAHDKPLTKQEIERIEMLVNQVIINNYQVTCNNMDYDDAIKQGVMALFGEKYTKQVRVISMGEFSRELCGGTHVKQTGDIGLFSITSESGVASGVRRIEAITGMAALKRLQKNLAILDELRNELKAQTNDIILTKLNQHMGEAKDLARQVSDLKAQLAGLKAASLLENVVVLANGVKSLVVEFSDMDNKILLELMDKLKHQLGSGIITLAAKNGERANLMVGVTKDLTNQYKAGNIIARIAAIIGGKGGGRPDLAQAAGNEVTKLSQALAQVNDIILAQVQD
jgi:alanyl-tRNA synthetase